MYTGSPFVSTERNSDSIFYFAKLIRVSWYFVNCGATLDNIRRMRICMYDKYSLFPNGNRK